MQEETKSYDDFGNLELAIDFKGQYTEYVYDYTDVAADGDSGRLVEKRFYEDENTYNNGAGTPNEKVTYTYDALGRQTKVDQDREVGDNDITEYAYDSAFGWLTQVTTKKGAAEIGRVVYTYHPSTGRVTSVATAASSQIDYTYDNQGRLKDVSTVLRNGNVCTEKTCPYRKSYLKKFRLNSCLGCG